VLVFDSADRDYFISHVDVTRISEYREQAAKLTGEASIGLLFRYLSKSRLVTIAQIEGRCAAQAERYGRINRALPAAALGEFVLSLAHRIAAFSAAGRAALKDRVNAIRSRRPRISVAIRISSWSARATRRASAECGSR
jgi:hypothetical protein